MVQQNDKGNEGSGHSKDIKEWIWGMKEDVPKGEVRNAVWLITGLSKETLILSILVKVVGGTEGKEGHSFLETLLVVHPYLGVGVLIGEPIKVPSIQLQWECQEKATDQHSWEGVLGWRSICWSSRMKRPKMLWHTIQAMGHSYFLPLRLGWSASAAMCLWVIAGVPGRSG